MSTGELLYLVLVLASFAAFGAVLGHYSSSYRRRLARPAAIAVTAPAHETARPASA